MRPNRAPTARSGCYLMHILLLGSGGREHALAWKIAASPLVTKLWCAPGNAGIAREAECVALDIADHAAVIDFCKRNAVDFVVVGPETPLAAGIVDDLAAAGIKAFGPSQAGGAAGGLQGISPRRCAREFDIPTGAYGRFTNAADALAYIRAAGRADRGQGRRPCGGQGRRGRDDAWREAEAAIDMMFDGAFGAAGAEVVIEEFLPGARSASSRCPTARPRSRWRPRRTTSACSTTTRARTPAAWAPIRRRRS